MTDTTLTFAAGADAFGDGQHPTTLGILTALEAIDPAAFAPRAACDIGCGSGILALSMARLFGCPVLASDIAMSAVDATRTNAEKNGLQQQITAVQAHGFTHPHFAAQGPFDLIVMNILAEPLLDLAGDAVSHLAPGGVLVLSGILKWQEPQLLAAYQGLGLELASRLTVADWLTLLWQKPE